MTIERIVRDPIYSFISFKKNGLLNGIVDTPEFQRLKDIRQLGVSYFTYPNAVHTRYTHSLGTYHLSKRIFNVLSVENHHEKEFSIAALLHDIGHGPFSHVFESEIIRGKSHEDLTKDIIESKELHISKLLSDEGIDPKFITTIIASGTNPTFLHRLISSQLDIDRFDYLLRDSLMTGNPHGGFDLERILYSIRLNDDEDIYVSKKGWFAVENFLICRYQMHKQVYYHHSTVSAEELLKKIIHRSREVYEKIELKLTENMMSLVSDNVNLSYYVSITDSDLLSLIKSCSICKDKILNDLANRFLNRRLFKPIIVKGEGLTDLFEKKEAIEHIISSCGYDPNYYFSYVNISSKKAYKPYSPNPKDQEESIYINPEYTREISQEIPSLGAIDIPPTIFLLMPKECREPIRGLLS